MPGLLAEIITMALGTLGANKLRSFLTVLGVVIGVTSIVGMTSLVRGFGDQLEALVRQLGSDTVIVSKFSIRASRPERAFSRLLKRPNLTEEDAAAIKALAPSASASGCSSAPAPASSRSAACPTGTSRPSRCPSSGQRQLRRHQLHPGRGRAAFTDFEVDRRRHVVMLGNAPARVLFPATDPLGKEIRIGQHAYTVVGVFGPRPGVLGGNPDEFAVIPLTTYDKLYPPGRFRGYLMRFLEFPRPGTGASRDQLIAGDRGGPARRHQLRLDEESDFDVLTADSILGILNQFTRAILLALVVISSIALMVGGIGVMAIMTISVTERTREIGVRKALGARRREILVQFLIEAVVLTSIGGILGVCSAAPSATASTPSPASPSRCPGGRSPSAWASRACRIFFGMWPA